MLSYIEYALGSLLTSQRGRDDKLFTKGSAFAGSSEPTIEVTCSECGPSNSNLKFEHSADDKGRFPRVEWKPSKSVAEIKEYLLVVEDPDAPLPSPVVHGIYHSIPVHVNSVDGWSLEPITGISEQRLLAGKFKYGQNRKGNVYMPPRPVLGHGPHRYFFQVIGLNQELNQSSLSSPVTKEDLSREIQGKVVGWGTWVGIYERTWGS